MLNYASVVLCLRSRTDQNAKAMQDLPDTHWVPQPGPRFLASKEKKTRAPGRYPPRRGDNPLVHPAQPKRTVTVFVGGSSRSVVNGVAFAMAEMLDLTPFWLDVRDRGAVLDGPDPASTGWIPPDRLFVSENGRGLESHQDPAEKALWTIVRSDEPASVLSHLSDFLHLPELIQEILSAAEPAGAPKALVAANTDLVVHLFPREPAELQRFLRTLGDSSLSIVAAHTGASGPGRFAFDIVFRVDAGGPRTWMDGTITCERGVQHGQLTVGRSIRLSDVPDIARVLEGLFATSQ